MFSVGYSHSTGPSSRRSGGVQIPADPPAGAGLVVVEPAADGRPEGEVVGRHGPDDGVHQSEYRDAEVAVRGRTRERPVEPLEEFFEPAEGQLRRGVTEGRGVSRRQRGPRPRRVAGGEQSIPGGVEQLSRRVLVADGQEAHREPDPLRRVVRRRGRTGEDGLGFRAEAEPA